MVLGTFLHRAWEQVAVQASPGVFLSRLLGTKSVFGGKEGAVDGAGGQRGWCAACLVSSPSATARALPVREFAWGTTFCSH